MDHVTTLAIPAATTLAELTAEPFLREFSDEVGVTITEMSTSQQDGRQIAVMDWSFRTDTAALPDLARGLLPDTMRMRWEQAWEPLRGDRATGRLDVTVVGRPTAASRGTCVLVSVGPGSTLTTSTRTKADLPSFLASRVESLIDKELVGWILSVQARVLSRRTALDAAGPAAPSA